jgi:hypothetical protein
MANHAAIQQQYGDLQAVLTGKLVIRIDVEHGNRGNRLATLELGQRIEHVLAQVTALAAENHEALRNTGRQEDYLRRGVGTRLIPWVADLEVAFTWLAMNSTVLGGTSPMAVTW